MRKVLRPEDVFELIERELQKQGRAIRNFKKKRIAAQEALGLSNPNIYDIYGKFQKKYKISDEQVQECIRLEIQIENEVLVPRTDMVEIQKVCCQREEGFADNRYVSSSMCSGRHSRQKWNCRISGTFCVM